MRCTPGSWPTEQLPEHWIYQHLLRCNEYQPARPRQEPEGGQTRDRTLNLLVYRRTLQPTELPGQSQVSFYINILYSFTLYIVVSSCLYFFFLPSTLLSGLPRFFYSSFPQHGRQTDVWRLWMTVMGKAHSSGETDSESKDLLQRLVSF